MYLFRGGELIAEYIFFPGRWVREGFFRGGVKGVFREGVKGGRDCVEREKCGEERVGTLVFRICFLELFIDGGMERDRGWSGIGFWGPLRC